jgi:hypothetical protein
LQLTGTLPEYLADMPLLTEVKLEGNLLVGSIPPAFGRAKLRRFQVEQNKMSGRIPATFRWGAYHTRFPVHFVKWLSTQRYSSPVLCQPEICALMGVLQDVTAVPDK